MPKKRIAVAVALALGAAAFEVHAQSISSTALPSGGRVVGGEAAISQQGAAMAIDQASARAAIDWQSFNIGSQASVTFNQPSASAIALNRVIGANGSEVFGRLSANGQVFLVNPNGVLFGRGAQVDVGGLLASTLNMSVDDFMAGRHVLRREGEAGAVVNQGAIRTAPRGYVALVAPSVVNEGNIESPLGSVSLAAGNAATVEFMADGLVRIRVDEGALQAEVANHGALLAEGGYVLLTAKALDSLARAVVNYTGIVEARSVKILGDEVILTGAARVDASGGSGGGEILIGGNYQGKGPEQNASRTYVGPDVTITADAITSGDGGRVIVWSDESTQFHGSISARGGAASGNGGFVETSGATLQVTGTVDTSAPNGTFGTWLLDPTFLIVAATGGVDLIPGINDTFASNVPGTTIISTASINSASSAIVLQANTDVEFRDPVDMATQGISLTAQAGRSVLVNSSIKTNNGHVSLTANDESLLVVPIDRQGGPATISMAPGTTIDAGNGDISLRIGTGCPVCLDTTTGDVVVEKLVARTVGIVHQGQTGSILRASDVSLIRAKEVFMEIESAVGPTSSIGTQANPIRISADKLEAHYHFASGGIFIESPEARDLQIGGVHSPLGGGGGVQAGDVSVGSGGGPIEIRVNGNLIQQAGPAGCGVTGTSPGGPVCSVDGPITVTATGAIKLENTIQTSNASASAIVLSAGHGTAAGTASGGDVIIGAGAVLSFGANGRATLFTGSIAGSSGVTALVGSGSGNFRYNSSPTSTGYSAALGSGLYAIYRERPTLTVTANSPSAITYGAAAPAYTFTLTGLRNGDTVAQALSTQSAVADDGVVSTSGKLTAGTHALTPSGGMDQLGYDLAYKSGTLTVDPASITAVTGIRASNKVYDATTSAMLDTTAAAFTGAVAGDLLAVATASGAFTDKHAGTGKTVNISGLTIGGADADNYILMSNMAATMADITRRAITVTARSDSKVYDQTTASAVTPLITSGTLQGADTAGFVQTYDTNNVGTGKTLTASGVVNDGNGGANYVVSFVTDRTGLISAKPISASGIVASSKIYDQTTAVNVDFASAAVLGGATGAGDGLYYTGDAVALNTASARGVFADKNAGIAKPVNVSGLALTGADAANYVLSTAAVRADIMPKAITATGITASDRTYDARTSAPINTSAAAIKPSATSPTDKLYYTGDAVALDSSAALGRFADKNVGVNKSVTVAGLALTGADAGNYVVSDASGATASITPATIAEVTGITANNKIFDGTTSATLNTTTAGFTGLVAGDALAVAMATGSFVDPNVGNAKTVNIGGITLGGSDAGNYLLASATASATANIIPATERVDAGGVTMTSTPSTVPIAPSVSVAPSEATALRVSDGPAINTAAAPQFTAPTWQALSDLWELRRQKLSAIDSAVRILESDPNAADLPDCPAQVEVASNCIAGRGSPPRRAAAEQPSPKLAHVPQIARKVALLIGIADYQGTIPKLGSPLKDVQQIGKLYRERFGYEVRVLPNADKATIVGELNRLIRESGPNDSVTVFYAGHGHVVEKTGRGYWIPGKASADEPSQWISNQDIGKFLARIPAKQILLVSDSCYSGTLARDAKIQRAEIARDPSAVLEHRSVTVLSSGGDEPVADSGKDGHSVFAWHFIRTAGDVEGVSRGVDIYEHVAERVKQDFPQEPQYGAAVASGHEIGADFLFEVRRY